MPACPSSFVTAAMVPVIPSAKTRVRGEVLFTANHPEHATDVGERLNRRFADRRLRLRPRLHVFGAVQDRGVQSDDGDLVRDDVVQLVGDEVSFVFELLGDLSLARFELQCQ
jgi:hypothetical protein